MTSEAVPYWYSQNREVIINQPYRKVLEETEWHEFTKRRVSVKNGLSEPIFVMGTDGVVDRYDNETCLNIFSGGPLVRVTVEKFLNVVNIKNSNQYVSQPFTKKFEIEIMEFIIPKSAITSLPVFIPQAGLSIATEESKSLLVERNIYSNTFHSAIENTLSERYFEGDKNSSDPVVNSPFVCYINNADTEKNVLYVGYENEVYKVPIQHLSNVETHCTFYAQTERGIKVYDVDVDFNTSKPVKIFIDRQTGLRKDLGFIIGTDADKIRAEFKEKQEKMSKYLRPDEVEDKLKEFTESLSKELETMKKENENLKRSNTILEKDLANTKVELDRANSKTQTTLKEREMFDKEADRQTKRYVSNSESTASTWKSIATVACAVVSVIATVVTCISKSK